VTVTKVEAGTGSRRLELTDGASSKFWEVSVAAAVLTVRFGRIGTAGQVQARTLASPEQALAERDKLVREKLKKGYADAGAPAAPAPTPAPATAKVARVAKAGAAAAQSAADATDGWRDAGDGYRVKLDPGGKLVCQNARGQTLSAVPRAVKESAAAEDLLMLVDWLEAHARECLAQVETWMLRSLPVPRAALEQAFDDPSWRAALENLVVMPVDGDASRAGFFRGVDLRRGIGLVTLDGETVWLDAPAVAIPHPVHLEEREDFRALGVELSLRQGLKQLFREVFRKPDTLDAKATSISDFAGAKFAQLTHALGLCRRLDYRVSGGSALTRIWENGRVAEARYWIGADDPSSEAYTDALVWVDERERALPLGEVGPIAFSEGMRMASAIHAGRVIAPEDANA
jgi:predicted DNA-binding WGR domain protein